MICIVKKHRLFPAIFLIFFSTGQLSAQDTGSGLDFLNIGPNARSLALSEATTASIIGPSAIYSNPSLLAFDPNNSVEANYTLWVSNVNNQFAALNYRHHRMAFAFGVFNSSSDGFEARDTPGPSGGSFSVGYLSVAGAIAYSRGPLAAGITTQYLREEVFQSIANGFAFSAGLSAKFMDDRILTGISIKNIGSMESLDQQSTRLPSSLNIGLNADLIEFTTSGFNDLPILVSIKGNWQKPIEENSVSDYAGNNPKESYFTIGTNINAGDLFNIQAGYRFGPTERPIGFGLGMVIEPVRVNYAIIPFSTGYGTVHSFGVQYYF